MEIQLTIQEAEKLAELCENPWHANELSNALYNLLEARETANISSIEFEDYGFKIKII